jgi:hypothetical protein
MRRMLYTAAALVFGVGVPLLVATEYTDVLFAWTVGPPLTAAFMGACYWSAGVLELLAARERAWARARVAVPGVLLFTALTCVPTVLNFRFFNLHNPAAYGWIAVYFGIPPILAWLWLAQVRTPGTYERRTAPMPAWLRASYAFLGVALAILGLIQFLAPGRAPLAWDLNPRDSQYANLARMEPYIGVWLLGFATVSIHAALEADLRRIRCVLASGMVLPVLQAVALARYNGTVQWRTPAAWAYLAGLAFLLGISVAGWRRLRALEAPGPRAIDPSPARAPRPG